MKESLKSIFQIEVVAGEESVWVGKRGARGKGTEKLKGGEGPYKKTRSLRRAEKHRQGEWPIERLATQKKGRGERRRRGQNRQQTSDPFGLEIASLMRTRGRVCTTPGDPGKKKAKNVSKKRKRTNNTPRAAEGQKDFTVPYFRS